MKTHKEADMEYAENQDLQETIDKYLTEEDKDLICSKRSKSSIRAFPGSELFHLYSEANKVQAFCENGHLKNVKGFGVDYLINRDFLHDWSNVEHMSFTENDTSEILFD